jgi:hypothetical protein
MEFFMNCIHVFITIGLANTEAAAILINFESPFIILAFGIEFKISISVAVKILPPRFLCHLLL